MVLHILRALFVLLMAAVAYFYVEPFSHYIGDFAWLLLMAGSLVIAVLIISVDILAPRKKLAVFSGTFFGLLVGITLAYALSFIVRMFVEQYFMANPQQQIMLVRFITLMLGVVTSYLAISFILQTKDDFRFIIPYVEFSKQTKGARPILLDTSVLIDGRIADIARTGILESQLVVPGFVLHELQTIADSSDKLKRNRGRRGLDVLTRLRDNRRSDVLLWDTAGRGDGDEDVDQQLMTLAIELSARVLTNDFNLNKIAQLHGVDVINLNELANALKPVVLPGEKMHVRLMKAGEEPGQGVGYLEDGTMVVVEQGRPHLDEEVEFTVTSVLQTSAGKMIFGRLSNGPAPLRRGRAGDRVAH